MLAERLGKYELLERLAIGGMGEIFLARQSGAGGFQRLVVVKRLIPELAERRDLVTLFIDEARIAAHLAHPNIVQIHDFGEEAGAFYLAMEYVPGQNLARVMERGAREGVKISRRAAVHVVAEVARGLEFAHAARDEAGVPLKIVHRDVSPHNVMLSVRGEVKLTDFGIATAAIRQQRTETGVVRGKVAYMSPEQVEGDECDARTDVYAAGIVLWELTLSRRMYGGAGEMEILRRARKGARVRPREVEGDYPEALDGIVMQALERDPARRMQTAGELAAALRGWLGGGEAEGEELGGVVRRLFPERPRGGRESELSAAETRAVEGTAEAPGSGSGSDRDPGTPIERPVGGRRRSGFGVAAWVMGAAAVVAAGAIWIRGRVAADGAGPVAPPGPVAPVAMAPVGGADAGVVGVDAGGRVERAVVADGGVVVVAGNRRKGRGERKAVVEAVPVPVEVGPAVGVAPGTLIVDTDPDWADVTVDGNDWKTTPARNPLAPGRYEVKIEVSKGGGSFHTTAVVESGKMTKCKKIGNGPFACDAPR